MSTHCQDPSTGDIIIFHFLPPDFPPRVWGLRLKKTLSTWTFSISYVARSPAPFTELGGRNSWILTNFLAPLFPLVLLWDPLKHSQRGQSLFISRTGSLDLFFALSLLSESRAPAAHGHCSQGCHWPSHPSRKSLSSYKLQHSISPLCLLCYLSLEVLVNALQELPGLLMLYCVVSPVSNIVVKILYKALCTFVWLIHSCFCGICHKIALIWERLRIVLILLGYFQQHYFFSLST